jgi:hypothetical protein
MNDKDEEDDFNKNIVKRINFADYMTNLINDEIIEKIYTLISDINKELNWCAALYGGRCWNNWLNDNQFNITDKIQQSSFLSGNFDILIITNDKNYANSQIYLKIVNTISFLISEIENQKTKYKINSFWDVNPQYRTIVNNSIAFFIYREPNVTKTPILTRGTKRKMSRKQDNSKSINSETETETTETENKLLLYLDLGIDANINIELFKLYFIETGGKPFLSLLGLFVISMFLQKPRIEEKGINIDDTRHFLFQKHLMEKLLSKLKQPSIENLIIHIIFVIFPAIFSTNYELKRKDIFIKLLSTYNVSVEFKNKPIFFKDFIATFNSYEILDKYENNMPSLRQLLQYAICGLHYYNKNISCIISGGDVLRRYLDENIIEITNDIDAKLFYSQSEKMSEVNIYKSQVIAILQLLGHFLHQHRYFKWDKEFIINIANIPFSFHIHSTTQEYVTSTRMLPKFVKPLISMDLKLKYTFHRLDNNNTHTLEKPITPITPLLGESPMHSRKVNDSSLHSELLFAPMDFVFWKKNFNKTKAVILNIPSTESTTCFYDVFSKKYLSTPLFSPQEIISEIKTLRQKPFLLNRIIQGKDKKDEYRLQKMQEILPKLTNEYFLERVKKMDQIIDDKSIRDYLFSWNRMILFTVYYFNKIIKKEQYLREITVFLPDFFIPADKIFFSIESFIEEMKLPNRILIQTQYNKQFYFDSKSPKQKFTVKKRGGKKKQKKVKMTKKRTMHLKS